MKIFVPNRKESSRILQPSTMHRFLRAMRELGVTSRPVPPEEVIRLRGWVRMFQGDRLVGEGPNKFVDQFNYSMVSFLVCTGFSTSSLEQPAYSWSIYLGTDTTTATTSSMTQLVSPIGTAPGTAPNSKGIVSSNPSGGAYRAAYTATWNAGTVSGTIGEIALYLWLPPGLVGVGTYDANAARMASRRSVADGNFTAYPINTGLPLSVEWWIDFSFA